MFTCLWKMWGWLDPSSMDSKKAFPSNQGAPTESPGNNETPTVKLQGNLPPQHLRLVQYGVRAANYPNQPPGLHQHPQLMQPPGIWGPMQQPPPVHYHQQRPPPNKLFLNTNNSVHQISATPTVPVNVEVKKKQSANSSQLRSPAAKRPSEGTVAMQGWLHKQGSEGLKVWRKRWFVLSDYCLFYYKGPEEEKVLGSILLPSYKVSLCGPEDKVYRKFAFKCEHANMRTYYLAADTQEAMTEWIQALNLACMLQSNVECDRQSGPSVSSMYNASLDNSDSGFHQYQAHAHSIPVHMHSYSNVSENPSNPSYSTERNCIQPLYANAPPKPRRLTDGGYSSPSPEFSVDTYQMAEIKQSHGPFAPSPQYSMRYNDPRTCSKSPVNVYKRNCDNRMTPVPVPYVVYRQTYNPQPNTPQRDLVTQSVERRTPDTYGRSKHSHHVKDSSDYEDVYSDEVMYKRPLSPVAYSNIKKISPVASITAHNRPYTPVYIPGPQRQEYSPVGYKTRLPVPTYTPNTIPRPHSADFLEYEIKHRNSNSTNTVNAQQPRPKSSLDITESVCDNYHYSKESYAEKMRKSALYLQQLPPQYNGKSHELSPIYNGQTLNQPPVWRTYHYHTNRAEIRNKDHQSVRSGSVLSDGSLDIDLGSSPYPKSPVCHMHEEHDFNYNNKEMQKNTYDTSDMENAANADFKRSASARLLKSNNTPEEHYSRPGSREGERKREESMKRLLEWKQRMLQSPLNRKLSSNMVVSRSVGSGRPDYYLRQSIVPAPAPSSYEYLPASDSRRSMTALPQYSSYSSDDEASGSICLNTHETFPRAISAKRLWTPNTRPSSRSATMNLPRNRNSDYCLSSPHLPQGNPSPSASDVQLAHARKVDWQWSGRMNMSAGELLGRTHEELVLLLIQLRRQSTNTCHSIETCYAEIDNIQSQLNGVDAAKRMENMQKLEQLKQHLLELEKQYEKGKPLVNLVDNMVKLGSLYRSPNDRSGGPYVRDRLEFNQQMQERRLLAEERRDWNRLSPNHMQLQAKVQQLYQLDRLLQEESGTLQGLHHDKEKIERALGGLRQRLNRSHNDPTEIEIARKQQALLENELSRVHYMLAHNSKKLEETVAGNARLEQELLVLRQKLQISRQQRSSPQFSNAGDSLPCAAGTSAMLESELHRVQQLVGDLQRQRQELSHQVRQLTDRSQTLSQQIRPTSTTSVHFNHGFINNKRRTTIFWRETDLDTLHSIDHGLECEQYKSRPTTPLYVNTENTKQTPEPDCYNRNIMSHEYQPSDDSQQQNLGCVPQEKQEIKTVRIVKRESERRQRDREKSSNAIGIPTSTQQKWDPVVEEEDPTQNPYIPGIKHETPVNADSKIFNNLPVNNGNGLNRQASISSPSIPGHIDMFDCNLRSPSNNEVTDKSPGLSPVFKSEAARQIIIEMSGHSSAPGTLKGSSRRTVPKEKRRHYTAPHNNLLVKSLNQLPTDDSFSRMEVNRRRARDDLDMERALRQRTDTPDVVRSTLSNKELKYNENTIDSILGTPNKISIPERYIPEQLPQLSPEEQQHRLRKVESIKKMLSDTTILSSSSSQPSNNTETEAASGIKKGKATSKMIEEKRQREHLLQLNQILAKQVMEMSKIVAVKALAKLPLEPQKVTLDEDDLSPVTPLPLYQQRDNYYS